MNILEVAYEHSVHFIQNYGWRIVALTIVYYFAQPYLKEGWRKMQEYDPREIKRYVVDPFVIFKNA